MDCPVNVNAAHSIKTNNYVFFHFMVTLVFAVLFHKFLDSVLEAIVKWLTDCTVDVVWYV